MEDSGFVPVSAIFYAVFHPTEGTKVVHQIPSGAIVPTSTQDSSQLSQPLIDFDSIKNYVIPKPQFCNRLITFKTGAYRVIGYPVNIYGSQYARNSFNFNFCFVFPYDSDTVPYEDHIRRIGNMFRTLEEQSNLLTKKIQQEDSAIFFKNDNTNNTNNKNNSQQDHESKNNNSVVKEINNNNHYLQEITDIEGVVNDQNNWSAITPGIKKASVELTSIESLIQQIFQDLNNYSECQIPIDSSNSIDIKLFPIFPPPPEINGFDVPIQTVKLSSLIDLNWDPTMLKILPFINGINSVEKISKLALADYMLTKQCIQHLMHYKCIVMLDIFQFTNIYAPTSNIGLYLEDPNLATECQAYVVQESAFNSAFELPPHASKTSSTPHSETNSIISASNKKKQENVPKIHIPTTSSFSKKPIIVPSKSKIFQLYRSLHHGQSLRDWCIEHSDDLSFIDVRRLISFGVLRNLIYRVHSFPVSEAVTSEVSTAFMSSGNTHSSSQDRASLPLPPPPLITNSVSNNTGENEDKFESDQDLQYKKTLQAQDHQLIKSLRRLQHFDSICTNMYKSRKQVEEILNRVAGSDWTVINS